MSQGSADKLEIMPVGRLLLTMSVPVMISMFVQAFYNLADSMFVAHISEAALTAVSLAYPVQLSMNAIAVGTGVGVSALVSRSLGRRDMAKAEKAANVQLFLSVCYIATFSILGQFFSRWFYTTQTDVAEIVQAGSTYLSIVSVFGFGLFLGQNFEKLLLSVGNSRGSMISQISGAVINLVLDPLLIFGLGPFPALGVKGAAIATVLGQCTAALIALAYIYRWDAPIRFRFCSMLPEGGIVREIYAIGFPSIITMGLTSVMSYLYNQILLGFSATAAAVFGIWVKVQSFGLMPVFGLNNGTVAIYSYNYGCGRYDRVRKTLRFALCLGIGVTCVIAVLYELIPVPILSLFDASPLMYQVGKIALRYCCLSLPMAAAVVILSSSFQSLGYSGYTLLVNISRQFAIQIPAAWFLSLSGRLELVWLAPLIAETFSMILAIFLCRQTMRNLDW